MCANISSLPFKMHESILIDKSHVSRATSQMQKSTISEEKNDPILLQIPVKKRTNLFFKSPYILTLYENRISLQKKDNKSGEKKFNFKLFGSIRVAFLYKKSSNNRQTKGVKFVVNEETINLFSTNQEDLKNLREMLKFKVIFDNFHEEYTIANPVGQGKFSHCHVIKSKLDEKTCLVAKFLRREVSVTKEYGWKSLENEVAILIQLQKENHRNIVSLHYIYELGDTFALLFEYLEGLSLKNFNLFGHYESIENVKIVMRGLLNGVKFIHSKEIMHRDLKFDNIMLRGSDISEENIVIIDFGFSCKVEEKEKIFLRCGSPGYVAPEILDKKARTPEPKHSQLCDIFSVGIIFHHLLLNCRPVRISNGNENDEVFIFEDPIYQTIEPDALLLLKAMLRRDPLERISAEEALDHRFFNKPDTHEEVAENFYLKGTSESQSRFSAVIAPMNESKSVMTGSKMVNSLYIKSQRAPLPLEGPMFFSTNVCFDYRAKYNK